MILDLKGKTALVCGSSQGIGLATAQNFAKVGAQVVLLARNQDTLQSALTSLEGSNHDILCGDLADNGTFSKVSEKLSGLGGIDILINNSGGPPGGNITEASPEEFLTAMTNHLIANQKLVNLTLPHMIKKKWGRIINIISTSVKIPIPGLGVSNTTRGAVANWAKTLSLEVAASGITVNNVLPGATETERLFSLFSQQAQKQNKTVDQIKTQWLELIPAARFGKPNEIANLITFLASDLASYINGTSIPVDGGRTGCH